MCPVILAFLFSAVNDGDIVDSSCLEKCIFLSEILANIRLSESNDARRIEFSCFGC